MLEKTGESKRGRFSSAPLCVEFLVIY